MNGGTAWLACLSTSLRSYDRRLSQARVWEYDKYGWVACEPDMARNRFAVPVIKNIYRPLVMGPGLLMAPYGFFWFPLGVAVGTVSD